MTPRILQIPFLLAFAVLVESYTRPDQLAALIALRDGNVNKGPGWAAAFNTTQIGGQATSSDTNLGGPWVCPTDPQYTNSSQSCDPCGQNRPDPYWDGEGASGGIGIDGWITDLHLTGLHLEGTLPVREFCAFHHLHEFDVDNSNFTGQIPDLICDPNCFENIQKIDWSYGHLTGTLPECIATMPWLETFKIENNYRLEGTIPAAFASAPHLWWQDYGYNRFSGSVPDSFITYSAEKPMVIFRMVNNTFTGPLYPLSRSGLLITNMANNEGLCGMVPNAVRFAHGYNTYNTNLGRPCPQETYPPTLAYAEYQWPI